MGSKMPGSCLMVAAVSAIWAKRFSSESTGDMSIRALMWLCKKKFKEIASGIWFCSIAQGLAAADFKIELSSSALARYTTNGIKGSTYDHHKVSGKITRLQ